jgi:hypothetical protein
MEVLASGYMPLSYAYAARYGEGRPTVPVPKNQAIYANFSHVSGVAAQDGTAAYSLDKLQILDMLIGRLQSAKGEPRAVAPTPPAASPAGSSGVDALIQRYGAELHDLATAPALPYSPSASASLAVPGMLFSLAA